MQRSWRTWVLVFLLVLPLLGFLGIAAWAIWQTNWAWVIWFAWPVAWGLAWILAKAWKSDVLPLSSPNFESLPHWTERDEAAMNVVEQIAERAATLPHENLAKPQFYSELGLEIAMDVARVYHAEATDPFQRATVVEILAAAELAMDDLSRLVDKYVPGSELLTIRQWQQLGNVPRKLKKLQPLLWAASAWFAPTATLGRYAASKTVVNPVSNSLRANVISWFYKSFVNRVGYYLIEMNSGRLRGGAEKFKAVFGARTSGPALEDDEVDSEQIPISVMVTGRASSGKTSLHEALAATNDDATEFSLSNSPVAFSEQNFAEDKKARKALQKAASTSDAVLMVMDATEFEEERAGEDVAIIHEMLTVDPERKSPPLIVVFTHIDRLDANEGGEAEFAPEPFLEACKDRIAAAIPVGIPDDEEQECYGVAEILVPRLLELLPEIQAVARHRQWQQETGKGKYSRAMKQVFSVGRELLKSNKGK